MTSEAAPRAGPAPRSLPGRGPAGAGGPTGLPSAADSTRRDSAARVLQTQTRAAAGLGACTDSGGQRLSSCRSELARALAIPRSRIPAGAEWRLLHSMLYTVLEAVSRLFMQRVSRCLLHQSPRVSSLPGPLLPPGDACLAAESQAAAPRTTHDHAGRSA